jgi:serine protease AprX
MRNLCLFLLLGVASLRTVAQEIAPGVYWVYFTDKDATGYRIDQPSQFLSERSVNRRAMQGLGIDRRDLPVTSTYLEEIRSMGVQIRHVSRWLNGAALTGLDPSTFEQVLQKPFTDTVPWEPPSYDLYPPEKSGEPRFAPPLSAAPGYSYGLAKEQVELMGTDGLHELGYTGKGVWIGVLDAGFHNVDSLPAFSSLLQEGRVLGTRNYVYTGSVYRESGSHGMSVLSIMAGQWDSYLVGTAPDANYLLCKTENTEQETRIEEIAWIEAAEYADSLGIDVINTSLGYSDFDGTVYDYSYEQMDGKSTFISRAASLLASRGMVLCNSAGNEGSNPWYYITAPADATDILAVGAVDSTNLLADFSSRGPSYDARIKPDVTAMGRATAIQYGNGDAGRGNGTSFASPVMAGSAACLWQAFPELPARELIYRIRWSGHRSMRPDMNYGFGTPNMMYAYFSITQVPAGSAPGRLELWPNPVRDRVRIRIPEPVSGYPLVRLYDLRGTVTLSLQMELPGELDLPESLPGGVYILEVRTSGHIYRGRLLKH